MWCESHVWEDDPGGEIAIICINIALCARSFVWQEFRYSCMKKTFWVCACGLLMGECHKGSHPSFMVMHNIQSVDPSQEYWMMEVLQWPIASSSHVHTKWCSMKPCRNDKNKCQGHCYQKHTLPPIKSKQPTRKGKIQPGMPCLAPLASLEPPPPPWRHLKH